MATKTIKVTEDAYRLLKGRKRPGESFSDVIRRTLGGGSGRALVGLLTEAEAGALETGIAARRERRAEHRQRQGDARP